MVFLSPTKSVRLHRGGADRKMDETTSLEEQSWGSLFVLGTGVFLFALVFWGGFFSLFFFFLQHVLLP